MVCVFSFRLHALIRVSVVKVSSASRGHAREMHVSLLFNYNDLWAFKRLVGGGTFQRITVLYQ